MAVLGALSGNVLADEAGGPISLSGVVEVEAVSGSAHDGTESSDVVLATVELAAEVQVSEAVHAQVVYLFEEDDTEPGEIDQGFLTLGNAALSPFYLSAGRM
jgi:hypothetical protein